MKHSLAPCAAALLASLATLGEAQSVVTVDAANRPGALFTSLSAAVATAAEGDVLLLRGGVYEAVTLGDKSLTVQSADLPGEFPQVAGLTVAGLAPGDSIVVRGLFVGPAAQGLAIEVADCDGPVWIEDVTAAGRVSIAAGRQVVLGGVTISEPYDPAPRQIFESLAIRDSRVWFANGSVSGPSGPSPSSAPGLPGAPAIRMEGGELWLQHVNAFGGRGSAGSADDCAGKPGASAVVLSGIAPELFVQGGTLGGGRGGAGFGACADGANAEPIEAGAGQVRVDGTPARRVYARSPLRERQPIVVDSRGEVGDRVFLLYSIGRAPALVPGLGWLQLAQPYRLLDTGGYAPGSDCDAFEARVPELGPRVEAVSVTLQALHWNRARGETALSNPIRLVLLDERF